MMSAPELKGRDVVVYGLGKSGLAAVKLLLREGAKVTVVDSKPVDDVRKALVDAKLDAAVSEPTEDRLSRAELLVVSPGVPLANPELKAARSKGVEMWGEVELAFRFLQPRNGWWIGVTGTNGKSTTTALTGELLRASGEKPFVGGNLGLPLCEAVLSAEEHTVFVVELSSFQLESIDKFHLRSAALLNLQPDHLDRYATKEDYAAAKARIFKNHGARDVAVVNGDDAPCLRIAREHARNVRAFSMEEGAMTFADRAALGEDVAVGNHESFRFHGRRYQLRNKALRGAHNVQNAMAAALLALHSAVDGDSVQKGLDSYPGLAHRMEFVRTLRGVEWINDSKATNVDSSLVALKAFSQGVWLIAGGKGKGAPYQPMVDVSMGRVKGVLTIGQDAETIAAAYQGKVDVHACGDLETAISRARELAKSGDTVLLSPACASYDQFKNFEDRGEQFKQLVTALSE